MIDAGAIREIRQLLTGVRLRQRQVRGLEWLVRGAIVGAIAALALEVAKMSGTPIGPAIPWLIVGGCALASGCLGTTLPISWQLTAHAIDQHYRMKDSTATALEFALRTSDDPFIKLQLAETIHCLKRVQPKAVIPMRAPKLLPVLATLCAMLASFAFIPVPRKVEVPVNAALQQVVHEQAGTLDQTMLNELRELSERSAAPELQGLVEEIERIVQELKQPNVEQREVLAKLSEMQQAVTEVLAQFNTEKTAADLKELAAALASAESMQAISEALKDGNYDSAAAELKKTSANSMSDKEKDAVADNLKKFRDQRDDAKESQLADSAQDLQEGLEKKNDAQFQEGAHKAADVLNSQSLKKSISQSLNKQLNRLTESKAACQSPSMAGGAPIKSEQASTKVGKAASNKPLGKDATQLDSQRHQETLTGIQGDGQSERETSASPDGEQDAARSYQNRYAEFHRQMEEVLDNEPLPLGHRETVRKYFESIRPTANDETE